MDIITVSFINDATKSEQTVSITPEAIDSGILKVLDTLNISSEQFTETQHVEMKQKLKEVVEVYQSLKSIVALDGFRIVIESSKQEGIKNGVWREM